jgi:hypothetical protein
LENDLTLPVGVAGEKVWEIPEGDPLLSIDTSYQLRITNLNGGYVSIDAFAGYWSGSMTELNEDHERITQRIPSSITQQFDKKYTGGSIYQWSDTINKNINYWQTLSFTGDRAIVYSKKGPNLGKAYISLSNQYGSVPIPLVNSQVTNFDSVVWESDGAIAVDLNSTTEIPQYVVFDSNDYFLDGLPWDSYTLVVGSPAFHNKIIYLDGIAVHETNGLNVKFINTSYLDIIKSTAEALNVEWSITERGLRVVPRIGTDTDVIMAEGRGTTIKIEDTEDISKVATMLIATGADIDGLPLSTVVENKVTRDIMGRTIQRQYDTLRNVGDYFTLVGASRVELLRRRRPERRIVVTRTGSLDVGLGDSFIAKTSEIETRVRANTVTRTQNSGGTEWTLECTEWPLIV